jgi:hypothetical protein
MRRLFPMQFTATSMFLCLAACMPAALRAQLERQNPAPNDAATKEKTSAPSGKRRVSQDVAVTGSDYWIDTNIDVQPAERLVITASGKLRYADAQNDNGPEGLPRGWKDLLRILPLKDRGRGALIARIGDADTGQPFLVGAKADVTAPAGGRLFVGINQPKDDSADGAYNVHIEIYEADKNAKVAAAGAAARDVANISGVDAPLFSKIPRRVADKDSNPGDMVNFLILGSESGMQQVFEHAGWVKVDSTPKDALLHGILESLSLESYVQMPMSQLYLFGRYQDYGFAHAEPIAVVAQRHHLRLWKAPFTVKGEILWVGAATHDIGFDRDQRNDGVTHKIDPNIDAERDYVEKTLSATGLVAEKSHFLPDHPLKEAKTATGGGFHSNGQVLILKLSESRKESAAK